jgi:AP-3 complex subunit delta-1
LEYVDKADGSYRESLITTIINICSMNDYVNVSDFEWYLSVLSHIAHIQGIKSGKLLSAQFTDVVIRVEMVRQYGVKQMVSLLKSVDLLSDNLAEGGNCEVLYAAAWLVGEFASSITDQGAVVNAILQPRSASLPGHIQR